MELEDQAKVKSLFRGLKLLDFFDASHTDRGVKELADLTGLLKSTVYNLLNTLLLCGYLERSVIPGKYRLGRKILELSSLMVSHDETRRIIKPYMDLLAEECREIVYFGQPFGTEVSYIDSSYPPGTPVTRIVSGIRAEMYCTSLGKAMLAFMGEELLSNVVGKGFVQYTPYTLITEDALRLDLAATRERGYAIDNMEHEYGIRCVGVPIRNNHGTVIGALSISGPSLRVMDDQLVVFADRLLKAASEIQSKINY